ncbi:MAG TPA: TIGR00282 family metallophosphoesterase [Chthonomonadales bacterium]|nr:TIGR00282 family metallophosphoesterase [Chthonomonadales bacterium]
MRVLFVGDVVGRPGRDAVRSSVPALRSEFDAHFVIANAENAAGGIGITPAVAAELLDSGVDALTLGNHTWAKREIAAALERDPRILRPANFPAGAPGRGAAVYDVAEGAIAVLSLQGRTFMDPIDDPFRVADELLAALRAQTPVVVVDFHAEATSEKQALAWHLDGRASAVVGTHTHVQTADERVLEGGTATITDVGMTGPLDSIIGFAPECVLPRFQLRMPTRLEVAAGHSHVCAVVIDIDQGSGRARSIKRIQRSAPSGAEGTAR